MKDSCERIQHYGAKKDETGTIDEPDDNKCINLIRTTLEEVKEEYHEAAALLKRFYGEPA